jgi:tetratricopeptide (TPR) repeat protein
MAKSILMTAAVAGILAGAVWAAGSGPAPMPRGSGTSEPRPPSLTPEEQAAQRYNDGLKHSDKADAILKESESIADAKKRAKKESEARKDYEKAKGEYESAVKLDASMYEAHGALGYVLRRLGDYDASLKSYDRALALKPGYPPAVEYRGEAYLGLNRVEDAKTAYMGLFNADRPKADMLVGAMKKWIETRRQNPAGVDAQTIEEFSKWVSQRQEIATQTSALLPPGKNRW